jgi:hypothetical protein
MRITKQTCKNYKIINLYTGKELTLPIQWADDDLQLYCYDQGEGVGLSEPVEGYFKIVPADD